MRLLASAKPMPLDGIGLSEANLAQFKQAMERPRTAWCCASDPPGRARRRRCIRRSASSTSLERKIWTAEDPIEITQPGLRQVQVNPKIDWTFAKALRAFLRADRT